MASVGRRVLWRGDCPLCLPARYSEHAAGGRTMGNMTAREDAKENGRKVEGWAGKVGVTTCGKHLPWGTLGTFFCAKSGVDRLQAVGCSSGRCSINQQVGRGRRARSASSPMWLISRPGRRLSLDFQPTREPEKWPNGRPGKSTRWNGHGQSAVSRLGQANLRRSLAQLLQKHGQTRPGHGSPVA